MSDLRFEVVKLWEGSEKGGGGGVENQSTRELQTKGKMKNHCKRCNCDVFTERNSEQRFIIHQPSLAQFQRFQPICESLNCRQMVPFLISFFGSYVSFVSKSTSYIRFVLLLFRIAVANFANWMFWQMKRKNHLQGRFSLSKSKNVARGRNLYKAGQKARNFLSKNYNFDFYLARKIDITVCRKNKIVKETFYVSIGNGFLFLCRNLAFWES